MAAKAPIVIVGAGGYARAIHDAITCDNAFDIVGFVDNQAGAGQRFCDIPVQPESDFLASGYDGAIAVALGDNALREKVVQGLKKALPQASYPIISHPRAVVSRSAHVGEGCVILAGAVVGANVTLGVFSSIWSNAVIEHDSVAADFVTLAPSATTGGSVTIGARTFLGLGCAVIHGVNVGRDCVLAAGAVLTTDCRDQSVMAGVPALEKKQRQPREPYL